MLRLSRFAPAVLLAAVSAVPLIGSPAFAQDATPPAAPTADASSTPAADASASAPAIDPALKSTVEDFWHYGKIARYDLSADAANKILSSGKDPVDVLKAFESVAADSQDKVDTWMLRWQDVDKMHDVVAKLISMLDEGRRTRRADPAWIDANIKMLSVNQRSYLIALERLRDSGELAVPQMLDYLGDPSKTEYQSSVRKALKDMGQLVLNPLCAATDMKDSSTLVSVINTLSEIGYQSTVPYLAKLAQKSDSETIRNASKNALIKMGASDAVSINAGDQFFDLGESFYYDKAAIRPDTRNPDANFWTWTTDKGLQRVKIPPAIFNDRMAMRSAKTAMELGTGKDAISLWLAGDFKREVQLADGKDASTPDGTPSAHFFGVSAGTPYLNAALARTLNDGDAAVALKIVQSLQDIVGRSNLLAGPSGMAIASAMQFNDRQVRFGAAFAAAAALPTQTFDGQDRVIPLLAEAVRQNGMPGILVLFPSDKVQAEVDALKAAGYAAVGGGNAQDTFTAASQLPAIDVILASDEVSPAEINGLYGMANKTPQMARAAKVVVSKTITASPDTSIVFTPATDAAGLKPVIETARGKTGGVPMDDKAATSYALRSADLMSKLLINNNKVLDVSLAQQALLAELEDTRPDVVKAVGNVLSLLNDKAVQSALASKASDDKTADDVKIAMFKALATNAKTFGNQLDADAVSSVQKAAGSGTNLDVRSAAAEACGGLSLPVDQAKTLIMQQ